MASLKVTKLYINLIVHYIPEFQLELALWNLHVFRDCRFVLGQFEK